MSRKKNLALFFWAFIFLLFFLSSVSAVTIASGNITSNGLNSTIRITGNLAVAFDSLVVTDNSITFYNLIYANLTCGGSYTSPALYNYTTGNATQLDMDLFTSFSCPGSGTVAASSQYPVAPPPQNQNQIIITQTLTLLSPTNPLNLQINSADFGLQKISANIVDLVQSTYLTITEIGTASSDYQNIGLASQQIYQAFRVDHLGINQSDIVNVTVNFKVNKDWMTNQSQSANNIKLYRRADQNASWNGLVTNLAGDDSQYYYFSAMSPGLSTFAIFTELPSVCQPGTKRCSGNETQKCSQNSSWTATGRCNYGCSNGECSGISAAGKSYLVYFIIGGVLIIAIIISYVLYKKFKKKKYFGF